jgi:hypothetical protein
MVAEKRVHPRGGKRRKRGKREKNSLIIAISV